MGRLAWVIALAAALGMLGGCFGPDYPVGLGCDPTGWCPPGQACNVRNVCVSVNDGGTGDGGTVGDGGGADAGLGELQAIDIGEDVTLAVGETHQFVVTGIYENGMQVIDDFAIWESSDNAVMFVDFEGVAHAEAEGTAIARARYMGRTDSALVIVTAGTSVDAGVR